jgi:protoporphyrinogen/coproporphyrinogen III oxidase
VRRVKVLEEKGGSLMGGALKLMQERKENPPPPRDPKLPPKPTGQTVASFRKGLQTLPIAIAKKVEDDVVCNWTLQQISKGTDGLFELTYETAEGSKRVKARSVGLTAPSYVVADLLKSVAPAASDALKAIDYPPVCAVTVAYPESAIKVSLHTLKAAIPGPCSLSMASILVHAKVRLRRPSLSERQCMSSSAICGRVVSFVLLASVSCKATAVSA